MEIRIAKHVKQLRSHGSRLRQLFRSIGPEPLTVANLAHLGNRHLIVRIVCEFRLKLLLGPAQVTKFQRQYSLVGMSASNGGLNFQRMMKTAQAVLRISHEEIYISHKHIRIRWSGRSS